MSAEPADLRDFLSAHAPFQALRPAALGRAVRSLQVEYVRRGQPILEIGRRNAYLYVVRKGAVEVRDAQGDLVARQGEGESFGFPSLLTGEPVRNRVVALEDVLLCLLPAARFHDLRAEDEGFARFYDAALTARIRHTLDTRTTASALVTPLRALVTRPPVMGSLDMSVRSAAQVMDEERVSSLLIMEKHEGEPGGPGRLFGIFTDRDLRSRVVAAGRSVDEAVRHVMTPQPFVMSADTFAFEALLAMTQRHIHHLPVYDDGHLIGMVTASDLMRLQSTSPVYLVRDISKQATVDGLARVIQRLTGLILRLIDADARAQDTGRVVTAVCDALTVRLLELAEARLGPPPVPYVWLALGSQARQEQTAHSDQDNALLLDDAFDPQQHDAYFADLARFVSDGLNACGFVYCPGDVMATNPRWRQPLRAWQRTFTDWIERPEPSAVMHTTIFFDMRPVYGAERLARTLRAEVLQQAQGNGIFLATLAADAMQHEPPLGFFRVFVLERSGDHKDTFDLKVRGLAPIVDVARVHALAHGVDAVGTLDRLEALAAAGHLHPDDAANLHDAYEYIAHVRLRHQGRQLHTGAPADNHASPRDLSPLERDHLKDAFKIVAGAQSGLDARYQTSRMR